MTAACPSCQACYRVKPERVPPEGVRLRCPRCGALFRVRSPITTPSPGPAVESASPKPQSPPERHRLVLVADPDPSRGKSTAAALEGWGLRTLLVDDGVEAILSIQRSLPRSVLLDVALPNMSGPQICELVKRNESLRSIWVVLVGEVHEGGRDRRPAGGLYEADATVERSQLPNGLPRLLRRFGLPLREAPAPRPPRPPEAPAPVYSPKPERHPPGRATPAAAPQAKRAVKARQSLAVREGGLRPPEHRTPTEGMGDGLDGERTHAERLARIIVSDIVLYNEERFRSATQTGNVLQAMAAELEEGRALFRDRVDGRVREERDYLAEELLRVARSRSGASS